MAGSTVSDSLGTTKPGGGESDRAVRRRERLVGTSRAVQRVGEQISVAGRGRFPVLITGEEGVDKALAGFLVDKAAASDG